MPDTWNLSRLHGRDELELAEIPLRWLAACHLASWFINLSASGWYRPFDWIGQRLMTAADKRRTTVYRMPLTPAQVRAIDPDWAAIWERLDVDEDEEIKR